jgi:uncharacterized protein YdhG (YjbR/CyaY superfamily)
VVSKIDAYINSFPPEVQLHLNRIRALVKKSVPEADESMSYGMPAYKLKGKPLIYFAGYKNHIGLYATPSGHEAFAQELSKYKQGKGSVQFPLDEEIPFELIKRIVLYRAQCIGSGKS